LPAKLLVLVKLRFDLSSCSFGQVLFGFGIELEDMRGCFRDVGRKGMLDEGFIGGKVMAE
jgi:hypothetical protein